MTNDRIQKLLSARVRVQSPTEIEREACEIISWLFSNNGAVNIADRAAWEIVTSESMTSVEDGHTWWHTLPRYPTLALDEDDRLIAADLAVALQYLAARQILIQHPQHPTYVRLPE